VQALGGGSLEFPALGPAPGGRPATLIVALLLALLPLAGCASTPSAPVYAGPTFAKPIEEVRKAAVNALVVTGFDIEKNEPLYVEGFKPRKIGLIVGSGGETVGIWLESLDPGQTRVRINTAKSSFGILGQKSWNAEVLAAMERELGRPQ